MKTSNNTKKRELIIKKDNSEIKTIFLNNKIYLTKKGISKLFWVSKIKIKRTIDDIKEVSNIQKENNQIKIYNKIKKKNKTYYSLDFIISIWYRLKSFENTKFILNSNKILKEHNQKRINNYSWIKEKTNFFNKILYLFNKNDLINN